MAKKSSLESTSTMLESVVMLERQLISTASDLFRNVTHIADIFFPVPFDSLKSDGDGGGGGEGGMRSMQNVSDNIISDMRNDTSSLAKNDLTYGYDYGDKNNVNGSNNLTLGIVDNTPSQSSAVLEMYTHFLVSSTNLLVFLLVLWMLNHFVIKSKILKTAIEIGASWRVVLILSPAIVLTFSIILVARLTVAIYLRVCHGGQIFLAHPMDSTWAYEKFASPSTCTGLYIVRGKCNYQNIKDRIDYLVNLELKDGTGLIFDRLRYTLRTHFGFVCWKRLSHFDASQYVKLITDTNPKLSGVLNIHDIFRELQRIHDTPFSNGNNLSPWEILVIPNYKHENFEEEHYALILRIHHAIMDGVSTGNVLHTGIADKPFKFSLDPIEPLKVSKFQRYVATLVSIVMIPLVTFKNIALFEKNVVHGPTLTGKKTFTWSRPIKLTTLKTIKNKTESSVFAVLMTCVGGSVRKLFIAKNDKVPTVIHAAPPIAILPFPDRKPRNRFSIVLFPVQIGIDNVLERLDAIFSAGKKLARSSDILANFYIMNILGIMPLFLIKILGYFAHATMTLSNIPGPAEFVTLFGGDSLVDVGAWVPVKNTIGIGMALFSYADRLRMTIIGDEACLQGANDVTSLQKEFEMELVQLAKTIGIEETVFADDEAEKTQVHL